jgi:hypothetical protein
MYILFLNHLIQKYIIFNQIYSVNLHRFVIIINTFSIHSEFTMCYTAAGRKYQTIVKTYINVRTSLPGPFPAFQYCTHTHTHTKKAENGLRDKANLYNLIP